MVLHGFLRGQSQLESCRPLVLTLLRVCRELPVIIAPLEGSLGLEFRGLQQRASFHVRLPRISHGDERASGDGSWEACRALL